MKKIININLSGRVIPIEDSAYETLQRYIESLRRYFSNEEGRDEIINDIESRIAELMNDKIRKGNDVVTDADVEEIINSMGRVEDFETMEDEKTTESEPSGTYTQEFKRKRKGRLYRDSSDKMIGGVCSGIANYLNVDPAIIRLLFAIVTFGGFGTGILIYILLWMILPANDLEGFVGKRLFRNPDDRVFSGVAGGLAAYFNKPSWVFRLVFAAPLLLNILFGVLDGVFFAWERDIFPNVFIGSFSGTFIMAYIILWIVLPEARSPFEKMEMRGETVDVNRIRQNVKEGRGDFKSRMEEWGEEVKTSAKEFGQKASDFANTRGKAFANEVADSARPAAQGLGHVIGVLFKAFFIFIAGCIVLSLFALLMAIIFGGLAWWPINNFLWTSAWQEILAWSTLVFFVTVPLLGVMIWLIRRLARARTRSRYLGWIFGGLWTIGWVCAVLFAVSIAKDLRSYERVSTEVSMVDPAINKLTVKVNEPEIRFGGDVWWIRADNTGWDITSDTIKYNNVKIRIEKSEDSLFHVITHKYSAGRGISDAQDRAEKTAFNIVSADSVLNLGSGLSIDRFSKFRGQGVIVEIQIPVGKMIQFDESLMLAYNPWVVRRNERGNRNEWRWRKNYEVEWDYDYYFKWQPDVDYIMNSEGKLVSTLQDINIDNSKPGSDSLQEIHREQKRILDSINREIRRTEQELRQGSIQSNKKTGEQTAYNLGSLMPLII